MARLFSSLSELTEQATGAIGDLNDPLISNRAILQATLIDDLVYTALFSQDKDLKQQCADLIYRLSELAGCPSTSIYELYKAFGEQKVEGFTVPAINVRALTYDTARLIFRLMKEKKIGAVVFEIARSEIEYTHQRPREYALAVLAGAIKEGYKGPVFLQGDHYQFSKKKFSEDRNAEINKIKDLIKESIEARFYNIDIDASTLVDLDKESLTDQQQNNSDMTALLTTYIHQIQPENITVSIGGEIGHIGGKNSTAQDFEAFMELYQQQIKDRGITKVSVQTGTSHGGIPLPDGTIQEVSLDFSVLKAISNLCREKYHMGGSVLHRASTLPLSAFDHFVENLTLEIHLATGLQNIVYDTMPADLKEEMYEWIKTNLSTEREEGWTDDQFIYKTRKSPWTLQTKTLGSPVCDKEPIIAGLTQQLSTIFEKLHIFNTETDVKKYVK